MGNLLKTTKDKLTIDQFKEYLNILKGVTYKLLLKRHIDVAIEMHEKIQKEDIDYLDGNTAGAVLANIRFKNTNELLSPYAGAMPSVSEYDSNVVFSDEIMDTNPRFWTIGQLVAGMQELEKWRLEFCGHEPTADTPQTSAEKKAATIQATLSVFKSVFAHIPEQTVPAQSQGAETSPNITDNLPLECSQSEPKDVPEYDIGEVVARIHAGFKQNKSFKETAYEIYQETKMKKSTDEKLYLKTAEQLRRDSINQNDKGHQTTTSPNKSSSKDKSASKEKESRREHNKSSTIPVEKAITTEEKKVSDETSVTAQNVESISIRTVNENDPDSFSSLDIPLTIESKPTLQFSDSLSEAFFPNTVSVLTRTGKVTGKLNESELVDNVIKHEFPQNLESNDNELVEADNDAPSEPDEPDMPEPLLD